jgi:hypothetical protein
MFPAWIPRALPSNVEARTAFITGVTMRVVRNVMTGERGGFDWSPLIERLKVRDLWSRDIEEKLTIMESEMLKIKPPKVKEKEPDA